MSFPVVSNRLGETVLFTSNTCVTTLIRITQLGWGLCVAFHSSLSQATTINPGLDGDSLP